METIELRAKDLIQISLMIRDGWSDAEILQCMPSDIGINEIELIRRRIITRRGIKINLDIADYTIDSLLVLQKLIN